VTTALELRLRLETKKQSKSCCFSGNKHEKADTLMRASEGVSMFPNIEP
jgi:hypothetical protein